MQLLRMNYFQYALYIIFLLMTLIRNSIIYPRNRLPFTIGFCTMLFKKEAQGFKENSTYLYVAGIW